MFLEHLASYNGADMHKYNTLYTRKLSWYVLTPTSCNDSGFINKNAIWLGCFQSGLFNKILAHRIEHIHKPACLKACDAVTHI